MKLMALFEWVQKYNGAIMVIITVIYVATTIVICIYNNRSAKAAYK